MPDTHRIIGRLVRDSEAKATKNGAHFCVFTVASEHGSGEYKTVSYFNCRVWQTSNERAYNYAVKYCKKGYTVDVVGDQMTMTLYTKRDGSTGINVSLNVLCIYSLPGRKGQGTSSGKVDAEPPSDPNAPPRTGGRDIEDIPDFKVEDDWL